MLLLLKIMVVVVTSYFGRMAGGGNISKKLPGWVPEIVFGLIFGAVAFLHFGSFLLTFLAFMCAWRGLQLGHETFYHMGYRPDLTLKDKDFLTPFLDWLAVRLKFLIGGKIYCWIGMAIKGALIGAATLSLPKFFALALLWPIAYQTGWSLQKLCKIVNYSKRAALNEYLSCAVAGVVLVS